MPDDPLYEIEVLPSGPFSVNTTNPPEEAIVLPWAIPYTYNFQTAPTGTAIQVTGGLAWTVTAESPNLIVSSDAAVANKAWQHFLNLGQTDPENGTGRGAWWKKPYIFRCDCLGFRLEDGGAASQVSGIQIGTPYNNTSSLAPPWKANPDTAYVRIGRRLNTTPEVYYFETCSGTGDKAPKVVTLSQLGPPVSGLDQLALIYDPRVPCVEAYLDGQLVYRETDTEYLPRFAASPLSLAPYGAGLYVETGSVAKRCQGFWSHAAVIPVATKEAALWYTQLI